jgi:hypothetical protein
VLQQQLDAELEAARLDGATQLGTFTLERLVMERRGNTAKQFQELHERKFIG